MFNIDPLALLIFLALLGLVYRLAPKVQFPFLWISTLDPFKGRKKTWKETLSKVPKALYLGGLLSLGIAFIDPHIKQEAPFMSDFPPSEGLAFYLVLDRSGSMGKIVDKEEKGGRWEAVTRFNRMQDAALFLIKSMPKELIGAVSFSRSVKVISPLTLDHRLLMERISKLEMLKDATQDGTSIGYAIYKTAHLIAASRAFSQEDKPSPYRIKTGFMIVITDGFQDPSILDKGDRLRAMELQEAAFFAKEKNIKVYIINIDPSFTQEQFAPNRREMQKIAEETGGEFFIANHLNELPNLLKAIPAKEKSEIYEGAIQIKRVVFYPYLITFGLILIGLGFFLDETLLRRAL